MGTEAQRFVHVPAPYDLIPFLAAFAAEPSPVAVPLSAAADPASRPPNGIILVRDIGNTVAVPDSPFPRVDGRLTQRLMMFFLGLLVGTTAGFFCAAIVQAASTDAQVRENAAYQRVQRTRATTAIPWVEVDGGEAANTGYQIQDGTGS